MSRHYGTQDEIIAVVKDYVVSGDSIKVVAERNNTKPQTLDGWLKKAGVKEKRPAVNWDTIREEAAKEKSSLEINQKIE